MGIRFLDHPVGELGLVLNTYMYVFNTTPIKVLVLNTTTLLRSVELCCWDTQIKLRCTTRDLSSSSSLRPRRRLETRRGSCPGRRRSERPSGSAWCWPCSRCAGCRCTSWTAWRSSPDAPTCRWSLSPSCSATPTLPSIRCCTRTVTPSSRPPSVASCVFRSVTSTAQARRPSPPMSEWLSVSVKLHLRYKQTNLQRHTSVCLSVCLSFVSVNGVHLMGGRSAMLHRNLRGRGLKILDQPTDIRIWSVDFQTNR